LSALPERLPAEQAEAHLRAVVETAHDGIIALDQTGHITLFNRSAERIFGGHADDVVGRPMTSLLSPADHDRYQTALDRFRHPGGSDVDGRTMQMTGLRGDGAEFPLDLSLSSWRAGPQLFFTAIVRDATERMQVDRQLRESETRCRVLIDQVTDYAIFMLDPAGHVITWNLGAERIKGYRRSEILGKHISVFYTAEDLAQKRPATLLRSALTQGSVQDVGWRVRKDGTRFWADVTLTPLYDEAGELQGFSNVTRDATSRWLAEEQARRHAIDLALANRELESFSYSVSHDLRAPLRAIDGFARILQDTAASKLDARDMRYLGRIRTSSQQMGQLIDDLLNLAHISRSHLRRERVDLSAMAEEVADEMQARQPQRAVEFAIAPGLFAHGDVSLLRTVMHNLIENAWKFTSKHPRARIEVGSRFERGGYVYYVRDDGAGFDMAYAAKLFGAFQRLHDADEFDGTGIGLATVQRIVHHHGGRVWAEGEVERGATFYFTLG
jgi:PAS domain S-box-containing protein